MDAIYSKTTHGIRISVMPVYLESQSLPTERQYAWAYNVRMENLGDKEVQLLSRYWKIADASGSVKEVRGPGVVGEQPVLKPGTMFEYTSGTLLPTTSGIMVGSYQMVTTDGKPLEVDIPAFSLDVPGEKHLLH